MKKNRFRLIYNPYKTNPANIIRERIQNDQRLYERSLITSVSLGLSTDVKMPVFKEKTSLIRERYCSNLYIERRTNGKKLFEVPKSFDLTEPDYTLVNIKRSINEHRIQHHKYIG